MYRYEFLSQQYQQLLNQRDPEIDLLISRRNARFQGYSLVRELKIDAPDCIRSRQIGYPTAPTVTNQCLGMAGLTAICRFRNAIPKQLNVGFLAVEPLCTEGLCFACGQ